MKAVTHLSFTCNIRRFSACLVQELLVDAELQTDCWDVILLSPRHIHI